MLYTYKFKRVDFLSFLKAPLFTTQNKETFGGYGYVHYLDNGNGFMGGCT